MSVFLVNFTINEFVDFLEAEINSLSLVDRELHYARNLLQPESKTYLDVLLGGYEQASDSSSAFHQVDPGHCDSGHADNSKFVHADGSEYVFRYEGSKQSGQFEMVDDPRNLGTFNFHPGKLDFLNHVKHDIVPWIRWGNSEADASKWTMEARRALTVESLGPWVGGVYESVVRPQTDIEVPGTAGNNHLYGSADTEKFRGFGGFDFVDYSASSAAVVVSLENGFGYEGFAKGDVFSGIENLVGSGWGDILVGNAGRNQLNGGNGADILVGLDGNDTLNGGQGKNTLIGGAGNDTFLIWESDSTIDGGSGRDEIVSTLRLLEIGNDTQYTGIEIFRLTDHTVLGQDAVAIVGSDRGEILTGNRFDNVLSGNGGNDVLNGSLGNDDLYGGLGNDRYVFHNGWGSDVIEDSGGDDVLHFQYHRLEDLPIVRDYGVNSGFLKIFSEDGENAVFVWNHFSSEDSTLNRLRTQDDLIGLTRGLPFTGSGGDDAMLGTGYHDLMDGRDGDDYLAADNGSDTLVGGEGNDTLLGGNGNDTYIFKRGFGQDQIVEAGAYPGEYDSRFNIIEFEDLAYSEVRKDVDALGRMTLHVVGAGGTGTDSIFIQSQSFNHGDGNLVEWVRFGGGGLTPIDGLLDLA